MPIVVDASALAEIVLRSERAPAVEALLPDTEVLIAPDIIGAEVLAVIRKMLTTNLIDGAVAERAVENLASAPVRRMTTEHLIREIWSFRHAVTPYDACYLALARAVGAPLVTFDSRLARAGAFGVDVRCPATSP